MMPLTLTDLLTRQLEPQGAATALVYQDACVSYSELDNESRRVARGLAQLGIGEGDRVALWLPNVPAWLACFFACARLGAIVVAVNTRFRSGEIADIVGRSAAKALVFWPDFRDIDFAGVLSEVQPDALHALHTLIAYDESPAEIARPAIIGRPVVRYRDLTSLPALDNDNARAGAGCIIFTTSGTTRAPKFVLHDQASITRHARDMGESVCIRCRRRGNPAYSAAVRRAGFLQCDCRAGSRSPADNAAHLQRARCRQGDTRSSHHAFVGGK
jgi:fatty-acyl-CoA synthase